MEKYVATLDEDFTNPEMDAGIKRASLVRNPAIKIKGYAFQSQSKLMRFEDEKKMRIAAPILVPMEIYRKKDDEDPEHSIQFTEKELDSIFTDMMRDFSNKNFINIEHSEEIAPVFLREVWQVDNPKQDKSLIEYGIEVPKGSIFGVLQFTDEDFYNKSVSEGRTGISIEGYFGRKLVEMAEHVNHSDTVILNENNEVLFLKRSDNSEFEPSKWGFVGGKIDGLEMPIEAGKRELFEETGIDTDIKEVGMAELKDGSKTFYFTAKLENPTVTLSDEHSEFKFIPIEEIKNLEVIKGENEAFEFIAKEAVKKVEQKTKLKMDLPDGEYKDKDGKIFVIKDGALVEDVKEELEDEKPADEKPTEDVKEELEDEKPTDEADAKPEEMADEITAEALTEEKVNALIDAKLEEVWKAFGELKAEATGKSDAENEDEVIEELSKHEVLTKKVLMLSRH